MSKRERSLKIHIKKLLEEPDSTVFLFEDEFSLSNTATVSYGWSIKGVQPIVECKQNKRERQTGLGSVNIKTGQMVLSFADHGNYQGFKKHLKKILRVYANAPKIILCLDNVRYHHARLLKMFLESHPKLELIYLPPYSPDLNPVERAWWYMRKYITHNRFLNSLKERKVMFWKLFSAFHKPNDVIKKLCVINY
jgi:transposase